MALILHTKPESFSYLSTMPEVSFKGKTFCYRILELDKSDDIDKINIGPDGRVIDFNQIMNYRMKKSSFNSMSVLGISRAAFHLEKVNFCLRELQCI